MYKALRRLPRLLDKLGAGNKAVPSGEGSD
jgi:hypothetical protein